MTTAKQARHSRFQAGSGTFQCNCCKRQTRDTGDNGDLKLCPQCYELGGYVNQYYDNGNQLDDGAAEHVRQQFQELASHLGSMEAARATEAELYDYVFPHNVQAAAEKALDKIAANEQPAETEEEGPGGYFVFVKGIEDDPDFVLIVDSTSSYQARRVAKRLVAKERSIDGLTFSARKA